jgi:septum formation protein
MPTGSVRRVDGMTLWRGDRPLILASQSRSRQSLLTNAGITFEAIPTDLDEREIQQSSGLKAPGEIAQLLACEKAAFVARGHQGRIVVGADQTLSLGERLFSKPAGLSEAAQQLQQLAGRTHELHSAIAVVRGDDVLYTHVAIARMTMRPLTGDEISVYLQEAGDAVLSSVGAYQLEKLGLHLFERIEGDHFTILGMPLLPLLTFLRRQHLLAI